MTHLLVKDLSRLDELDRQTARAVRGGILIISKPIEPTGPGPWPTFPGMPSIPWPPMHLPVPPVHVGGGGCGGGGGPVIVPYHSDVPTDPRLQ